MTSFSYRLSGLLFDADIPFPELTPAAAEDAFCVFRLASRRLAGFHVSTCFLRTQLSDGRPWLSCVRCDGGYLLRFENMATFFVSREGHRIECDPETGVPPHTVRHLFLDTVFPLILNLRGHHALHATVVAGPRGACAFVGGAGLGKSTLAAAFLREGWSLVCDDCLRLELVDDGVRAVPSYPGLRLWPDATVAVIDGAGNLPAVAHYSGKARVTCTATPARALSLQRLYILGAADDAPGNRIRIEPQSSRNAFVELLRHSFRLDLADAAMLFRQFRFLQGVVGCTPVHRLKYPRDFVSLPAVVEAIIHNLEDERDRCD